MGAPVPAGRRARPGEVHQWPGRKIRLGRAAKQGIKSTWIAKDFPEKTGRALGFARCRSWPMAAPAIAWRHSAAVRFARNASRKTESRQPRRKKKQKLERKTMKPIDQMSQIELARRRKFWTINEMARRCGLSQGTCWHAEVGHDVRPENLRKIHAILGIKKSAPAQ